jgi:hypothetical protein
VCCRCRKVLEAVLMPRRVGVTWTFIDTQAVLWFLDIGFSHFAITSEKRPTV